MKRLVEILKTFWSKKAKPWISENNEVIGLLVSFFLLIGSKHVLRIFDPLAGTFDLGVLQSVIVATFGGCWVLYAAWISFKLSFPKLGQWFDDTLEKRLDNYSSTAASKEDKQANTTWSYSEFHFKKAELCFKVYFAYVAVFTIILIALL